MRCLNSFRKHCSDYHRCHDGNHPKCKGTVKKQQTDRRPPHKNAASRRVIKSKTPRPYPTSSAFRKRSETTKGGTRSRYKEPGDTVEPKAPEERQGCKYYTIIANHCLGRGTILEQKSSISLAASSPPASIRFTNFSFQSITQPWTSSSQSSLK